MNRQQNIICPLCSDRVEKLVYRYHLDNEKAVLAKIKEYNPEWAENGGACCRCVDYYHTEVVMQQRMLPEVGPYFPVKSADDFIILPTGLRLDADPRYTGKRVTICFIDSGFYPHPDLTAYKNRIKIIVDIPNNQSVSQISTIGGDLEGPPAMWHGTMTSVVCAGDGYLSKGLYKGIASDAELVLVKVMNNKNRITTENIVKALQWVLENHEQYEIRIVNMSLGDDEAVSYKQSEVDRLVEQLNDAGIIVVAAAGNDEMALIKPPANSPYAIAIGGVDDNNQLDEFPRQLYHSSYGNTVDALMKPELLAHAIWIAAPILPETKDQKEAELLYDLMNTSDKLLRLKLSTVISETGFDNSLCQSNDVTFLREKIVSRIQACKFISPHYMHVDGTSFAAPLVSAVIAQLLEADPQLSPPVIREILFSTAKRISSLPAERQGFGLIRPRRALLKVLKRETIMKPHASPYVNKNKKTIEFYINMSCASQVSLAGSFNQWAQDVLLMEPGENGLWRIEIPMLPAGNYPYKFLLDEKQWIEDVDNPYREPDGFNGFNSILMVPEELNGFN